MMMMMMMIAKLQTDDRQVTVHYFTRSSLSTVITKYETSNSSYSYRYGTWRRRPVQSLSQDGQHPIRYAVKFIESRLKVQ